MGGGTTGGGTLPERMVWAADPAGAPDGAAPFVPIVGIPLAGAGCGASGAAGPGPPATSGRGCGSGHSSDPLAGVSGAAGARSIGAGPLAGLGEGDGEDELAPRSSTFVFVGLAGGAAGVGLAGVGGLGTTFGFLGNGVVSSTNGVSTMGPASCAVAIDNGKARLAINAAAGRRRVMRPVPAPLPSVLQLRRRRQMARAHPSR